MYSRLSLPFGDDTILLIHGDDAYVDPYALAAAVGFDSAAVRARVSAEPFCRATRRFRDMDTGRGTTLLRLDYAQLLLCSIHPSRVKNRDRLLRYQLEFRNFAESALSRVRRRTEPPTNLWDQPLPHRQQMFPEPVIVPAKDPRRAISQLLRSYCHRADTSHEMAWRDLYREVRYRLGVDLVSRAENRKIDRLDVAEQMGIIEKVYAIAYDLFALKGNVVSAGSVQ